MAAGGGGGDEMRIFSANVVGRSVGGGCGGFEASDEKGEAALEGDCVAKGLVMGDWALVEVEKGF